MDGDRCTKSAYEKYEDDFETITQFFPTAVAKIPEMKSIVKSRDKAKSHIFAEKLEIMPIVACKGFMYFGCKKPSKIDMSPLNMLFDGGQAKYSLGVMKMETGMVYAAGMDVTLRLHRQIPRTVHPPPLEEQHEVKWKVLGVLFSRSPGGERVGFEPILIVYNPKISRYDHQYEEDRSGTKVKFLKKPELPDVAIVDYPRWKYVPLSKVKFITYNKALVLNEDENNIRKIALQGIFKDPQDPNPEENSPDQDQEATDDEEVDKKIVPTPSTTKGRGRGRPKQEKTAEPRASSVRSNAKDKTIASLKKGIESADATIASLKERNELLKADNTKMEKKLKEAEGLADMIAKADRFKTSVLEFFQSKYEDLDQKKKPATFAEYMPKALHKYFCKSDLE